MAIRYAKLELEELEPRDLLAAWAQIGLGGLYDGAGAPIHQGTGPFEGRVPSLAYSSNHDGKGNPALFAGFAGGGVWRTLSPGAGLNAEGVPSGTWTPLTDGVAPLANGTGRGALNTGSLALDPNDPTHLVVGTGEYGAEMPARGGGLLNLTKGGDTVARLAATATVAEFDDRRFTRVLIDPSDSQHILAAVSWQPTKRYIYPTEEVDAATGK
ncbi:MAG: hypothetical protein K2W96_04160 [Gemmataceae bacterium]|nr:hypothetical protein [Gemmataceae bacterium]